MAQKFARLLTVVLLGCTLSLTCWLQPVTAQTALAQPYTGDSNTGDSATRTVTAHQFIQEGTEYEQAQQWA